MMSCPADVLYSHTFLPQIINQQVLPERFRGHVERPAAVDTGHLVDKSDQRRVVIQHEDAQLDATVSDAFHLFERFTKRGTRWGIVKMPLPPLVVHGRLAVSDDDD